MKWLLTTKVGYRTQYLTWFSYSLSLYFNCDELSWCNLLCEIFQLSVNLKNKLFIAFRLQHLRLFDWCKHTNFTSNPLQIECELNMIRKCICKSCESVHNAPAKSYGKHDVIDYSFFFLRCFPFIHFIHIHGFRSSTSNVCYHLNGRAMVFNISRYDDHSFMHVNRKFGVCFFDYNRMEMECPKIHFTRKKFGGSHANWFIHDFKSFRRQLHEVYKWFD